MSSGGVEVGWFGALRLEDTAVAAAAAVPRLAVRDGGRCQFLERRGVAVGR